MLYVLEGSIEVDIHILRSPITRLTKISLFYKFMKIVPSVHLFRLRPELVWVFFQKSIVHRRAAASSHVYVRYIIYILLYRPRVLACLSYIDSIHSLCLKSDISLVCTPCALLTTFAPGNYRSCLAYRIHSSTIHSSCRESTPHHDNKQPRQTLDVHTTREPF